MRSAGGAMAARPKRKREEGEETGAAPHDGAAAPFPLAELSLRRVLRESARDKAVFLHGQVPGCGCGGGGGRSGRPAAIFLTSRRRGPRSPRPPAKATPPTWRRGAQRGLV